MKKKIPEVKIIIKSGCAEVVRKDTGFTLKIEDKDEGKTTVYPSNTWVK